jgi:hypothetical protein
MGAALHGRERGYVLVTRRGKPITLGPRASEANHLARYQYAVEP